VNKLREVEAQKRAEREMAEKAERERREEADRVAREQEEAEEKKAKEERDIWEQSDGPAYINTGGELIIPTRSIYKYRYWSGGQSLWETLVELNAPLALWRRYAGRDGLLLTDEHQKRCTQPVKQGDGFHYCAECGYWLEVKEAA
jgi:hypothetical protein